MGFYSVQLSRHVENRQNIRHWRTGEQIKKNEMDREYGTYGKYERFVQGFSGEIWGKETTWKTYEQMGRKE